MERKSEMDVGERYDICLADNNYNRIENIEKARIKNMMQIALNDIEYTKIRELKADIKKECSTVFKLYYDSLHGLCEAFVIFDKIKVSSHECLFVYLCTKHTELELDLNFLDEIRTKRNGICHYGNPIDANYWNSVKLKMEIYIKTIRKEIEEKLNNEI
jgi:hypothetical protein